MADKTGVEIYFPQYPLAPENTCIDALAMLAEIYRMMLEKTDAKDIVIMGDSAGGGIALSAAMYIRELGLPQPGDIILISPAVLMECSKTPDEQEYMTVLEKRDRLISSKCFDTICDLWRGELERTDYKVNPIYGDLHGLGRITVFISTGDVLNIAVRKFRERAKEQNVEIDYYEKENMMHCWVLLPCKESKKEREIITGILANTP